ncbi:hypothetical protein BROUX41_000137 [Berkeleyomyces rouxiae]|uniref:uncharacterized protein n=1 Tax=Berkeleyomyces rouxiae TaxID=2035830 RepID=UPI003B7F050B
MAASDKLFQPLRIGNCDLQHRIVMAPMTRLRCDSNWVPTDMVAEYYAQRACVPGTLIMTEGTQVSKRFVGMPHVGGIWSDEQIAGWKKVTDAVHAKGSFIWCQLWIPGRAGMYEVAQAAGTKLYAPSAIKLSAAPDTNVPVEMTLADIEAVKADYTQAAKNAMAAGFDGVQLHCAKGYLADSFLQDVSNTRTDAYGGSIEKRARFPLEVMQGLVAAVGAERVGIRISPWSSYNDMGMADPVPQFTYLVRELSALKPAFLDLVEPRVSALDDCEPKPGQDNTIFVKEWACGTPVLLSGGFTAASAREAIASIKTHEIATVMGRNFTSNPDLVFRIRENIELTPYDRPKFFVPQLSEGYADWPFSKEFLVQQGQEQKA